MKILSLLGAALALALVVTACGGGTEYQTADAVKAFNAYQDNAKYGIALACPETVPADAEFECTYSTKGGTPQKATFVIEKGKIEPTDEQAMGQAMLDATTPQFWGDNTLPGFVDQINADPIVKAADLNFTITCPKLTSYEETYSCTVDDGKGDTFKTPFAFSKDDTGAWSLVPTDEDGFSTELANIFQAINSGS
ncbi:MAG: hypothetical protein NTX95_09350 [Actinobacteria bacterium]|nr:hypothetical protein [Actinomycetota bacterium]